MTGPSCSCGQRRAAGPSAELRVLVVDNHPMVRTALSEILSDEELARLSECIRTGEREKVNATLRRITGVGPSVVANFWILEGTPGSTPTETEP